MNPDLQQLVATELNNAGFAVQGNLVNLKNRSVSTLEVRMVLERAFPEVDWHVRKTDNGVRF